jgi:hypothetical protein
VLVLVLVTLRRSRVIGYSYRRLINKIWACTFWRMIDDRDICVVWELGVLCIMYHACVRIGTSMALKVNESKSQE